jgi:hypothetical protein
MFVPVVDQNQNPLMPTTPSRASRCIKSGKATHFWKRGVFCVRLNIESYSRNLQPSAIGVDPGSNTEKLGRVETQLRSETKKLCSSLGLKKFKNKLAKIYSTHCLDSGVLANSSTAGHCQPDNTEMLIVILLRFYRSQLHRLEHAPGHGKSRYDGTLSHGLKRVCLVKNRKYGLTYMGGFMDKPTKNNLDRQVISLHCPPLTGKRLSQNAVKEELRFLTFNYWRTAIKKASSVQGGN